MIDIDIKLKRKNFTIEIKEVFKSGITGVYGPSGSGKSSLLSLVAGLEKPDEGRIKVGGKTLFCQHTQINTPINKRNIAYVFQEGRLFPHMTVEQNLRYGERKGGNQLGFTEVVEMLEISHLLKSMPSAISGGERQRTALGRSLLSSPDLLLLDEPFSALDINIREQIIPFILKIQQSINIPILVVSHEMTDLLKLSSQLFLINQGKCIGHGEYLDLLKKAELKSVFRSNTVINAINMNVIEVDASTGLTHLSMNAGDNQIKVLCEESRMEYQVGDRIKIFIRSEDIALSNFHLNEITIQNQLRGVVEDLVVHDHVVLCMVNVGFTLVVEITEASMKRMGVEKGSIVFCLFKSVAIDLLT